MYTKNKIPFTKRTLTIATCACVFLLTACSKDRSSSHTPPQHAEDPIVQGSAIKGPIVGASVKLYVLDLTAADLKGELLLTTTTNESGAIDDLTVSQAHIDNGDNFIVEVSGGEERNGTSPVISQLTTLLRGSDTRSGNPLYLTPLSTLALELARLSAQAQSTPMSFGNFLNEIETQEQTVKDYFGLGVLNNVNLIATGIEQDSPPATAPVLTMQGNHDDALAYRTAIEVTAALVKTLNDQVPTVPADQFFKGFAQDLSDGIPDGSNNGTPIQALSGITPTLLVTTLTQPVSALKQLNIPGTSNPISTLNEQLISEAAALAPEVSATNLTIPAIHQVVPGIDSDNDRIIDSIDEFDNDPRRSGDNDGDGFDNLIDRFPNNPSEWLDSDDDGIGDNTDICPNSATETQDSDGDGFCDYRDFAPNDPNVQIDPGNIAPIAVALASDGDSGVNREVNAEALSVGPLSTVALSGSSSSDPNPNDTLIFSWEIISDPLIGDGHQATLSNNNSPHPILDVGELQGDIIVRLTVRDNANATHTDDVTITVNKSLPQSAAFMGLGLLLLLGLKGKPKQQTRKQ